MFFAWAGSGRFPRTADAVMRPFEVPKRVGWLAALVMMIGVVVEGQSLDPIFTMFPVPTSNSSPSTVVTGPDGALWFTEMVY